MFFSAPPSGDCPCPALCPPTCCSAASPACIHGHARLLLHTPARMLTVGAPCVSRPCIPWLVRRRCAIALFAACCVLRAEGPANRPPRVGGARPNRVVATCPSPRVLPRKLTPACTPHHSPHTHPSSLPIRLTRQRLLLHHPRRTNHLAYTYCVCDCIANLGHFFVLQRGPRSATMRHRGSRRNRDLGPAREGRLLPLFVSSSLGQPFQ